MPAPNSQLEGRIKLRRSIDGCLESDGAYLEQRFIGGRGCRYLNGVELLLEFGPVVVYVRHCDHDTGRRGEGRPSVVPDRHLKTKIKFLRIEAKWKFIL